MSSEQIGILLIGGTLLRGNGCCALFAWRTVTVMQMLRSFGLPWTRQGVVHLFGSAVSVCPVPRGVWLSQIPRLRPPHFPLSKVKTRKWWFQTSLGCSDKERRTVCPQVAISTLVKSPHSSANSMLFSCCLHWLPSSSFPFTFPSPTSSKTYIVLLAVVAFSIFPSTSVCNAVLLWGISFWNYAIFKIARTLRVFGPQEIAATEVRTFLVHSGLNVKRSRGFSRSLASIMCRTHNLTWDRDAALLGATDVLRPDVWAGCRSVHEPARQVTQDQTKPIQTL